ncbi:MAG: LLM class flavin-dependent oxidoreductase [Candidatus Sulfotelmatobacter sp.]
MLGVKQNADGPNPFHEPRFIIATKDDGPARGPGRTWLTGELSRFLSGKAHPFRGLFIQLKMSNGLAVSVLDLVGMREGESAGSAIARSVDLAQHVERWGYKRYWLAEHHSIAGLACSATPVLIGHVAGATKTIRVGSGGVMLPNHAPLIVAEQFGTLEALYPGRIDLGLGRAPGGDFKTMRALRGDSQQSGDDFPALLQELRAYLGPEKPGQSVKAIPGQGSHVPITLLGSSGFSAQLAGMLGLPFAFAAHFAPEYLYAAAQLYREQFGPSEIRQKPYLIVAVQIIAAETDAAARRLFTTPQQRFLRLIQNQPVELLPPVDSMEPLWQNYGEQVVVESKLAAAIVGSSATVKAGLEKLAGETGADEVIVVTDTYEHADRLQSYQRVAESASMIQARPAVAVGS